MDSPTKSFVDDLVAHATVKTYGDISFITVPGIETIPESHHMAIFKRAEQRLISDQPDADDLLLRLQAITPPPDEEEDAEECRVLEAQARQDLESDGCPPCYPSYLNVPVRDPPEEYRQIIEYWQSFSSTEDMVLCTQRADWQKFRQSQQRLRYRYRNRPFSVYVDKIRERRRAHELGDNIHLLLDTQDQTQRQNWIEFQDYHLRLHNYQKEERDRLQQDLDNARKEAGNPDVKDPEFAALREYALQQRLEYAERKLGWEQVMLHWIEQRRLVMDPLGRPPTPNEQGSSDQNSAFNRGRRSKRRDIMAVLGNVKVSKSTPTRQNMRTRTSKATMAKAVSVDSTATIPSSTRQQMPKRREIKPRRAKEKALAQILPQRVAKTYRPTDAVTKSQSRTQRSVDGQVRSATQQLRSTPGVIKTRSQRISKEPVRWVPE